MPLRFNDAATSDFVIVAEGKEIFTHRSVVMQHSSFLNDFLLQDPECTRINANNAQYVSMCVVLESMYDNAPSNLFGAHAYNFLVVLSVWEIAMHFALPDIAALAAPQLASLIDRRNVLRALRGILKYPAAAAAHALRQRCAPFLPPADIEDNAHAAAEWEKMVDRHAFLRPFAAVGATRGAASPPRDAGVTSPSATAIRDRFMGYLDQYRATSQQRTGSEEPWRRPGAEEAATTAVVSPPGSALRSRAHAAIESSRVGTHHQHSDNASIASSASASAAVAPVAPREDAAAAALRSRHDRLCADVAAIEAAFETAKRRLAAQDADEAEGGAPHGSRSHSRSRSRSGGNSGASVGDTGDNDSGGSDADARAPSPDRILQLKAELAALREAHDSDRRAWRTERAALADAASAAAPPTPPVARLQERRDALASDLEATRREAASVADVRRSMAAELAANAEYVRTSERFAEAAKAADAELRRALAAVTAAAGNGRNGPSATDPDSSGSSSAPSRVPVARLRKSIGALAASLRDEKAAAEQALADADLERGSLVAAIAVERRKIAHLHGVLEQFGDV